MADQKTQNTPMSIDRITALITAMEEHAWRLVEMDMEQIDEGNLYVDRRAERWLTLRDVKYILTNPKYAEALAKIFLTDDEEDTEEGGEFDA